MVGADDPFGAAVTAVLVTLLVCGVLAIVIPTVVTVWAARAKRSRLWLVSALAFVGVVSAEVFAIVTFMVLKGETASSWAVVLFGALAIAAFVGLAKLTARPA